MIWQMEAFGGSLEGEWLNGCGYRDAGIRHGNWIVPLSTFSCFGCNTLPETNSSPPKNRSSQEADLSYPSFQASIFRKLCQWGELVAHLSFRQSSPRPVRTFKALTSVHLDVWHVVVATERFLEFSPRFFLGEMNYISNLTCAYFSNGLVQPPARKTMGVC